MLKPTASVCPAVPDVLSLEFSVARKCWGLLLDCVPKKNQAFTEPKVTEKLAGGPWCHL